MSFDTREKSELEFERKLIDYLSTGTAMSEDLVHDFCPDQVFRTQLWKYEPDIKTTEQLWDNFKKILESHNRDRLDGPLSPEEFRQIRNQIENLKTPYEAGQFLYGMNGISQLEVDLDNGKHQILTVFDQKEIGGGNTVYQVVNQIQRKAKIPGKRDARFDVTLLINGLPIIQIELKASGHRADEALNQMQQYIDQDQYTDIFSTLQILVAMTPNEQKYMANTSGKFFNKDFSFNWQRKTDHKQVNNWYEFSDLFLSIPMAHQMSTSYMILDGTENKEMIKVMKPYQVYATQGVIERVQNAQFRKADRKGGYVWHTTGSGKTITSFKTAWLASRIPHVEKVVFVVDRIALTRQTVKNYQAYDPDASATSAGQVLDVDNVNDLKAKLREDDPRKIVVTSVQKLERLIKRKNFKAPDKNIVFIVDEAHRSTGGEVFEQLQDAFPHSIWFGYTGTPMFDGTSGKTTHDIFGDPIHIYTIRDAIADQNVLGFKVDFKTTIDTESMRNKYLPEFYLSKYPKWTDEQIQDKIDHLTEDDMDDMVEPSFYDNNEDHVRLVVEDIFKNWKNRSNNGKYNALLTTHVGGGKPSTPMAMQYFDEFQRVNEERAKEGKWTLKVAVTFSQNRTNNDNAPEDNKGLSRAMAVYNETFGTTFDDTTVAEYTADVEQRLKKSSRDKNYLDLVIVVDQLLTGFDAPELNTLYVDRTLKGAGLIQAYSRTNRIADMQEKPWGRIVNYRWPATNEKLMNQALSLYANRDSAAIQESLVGPDNVIAPSFEETFKEVKALVEKIRNLTDDFNDVPKSESDQDRLYYLLRKYNPKIAQLKQYDPEEIDGKELGFDYDHPDELILALGMVPDEEARLTNQIWPDLRKLIAQRLEVPIQEIDLKVTHIKDVRVNYDYLTELLEQLMNQKHEQKEEELEETKEKIREFARQLTPAERKRLLTCMEEILSGKFLEENTTLTYPYRLTECHELMEQTNRYSLDRDFQTFRDRWGVSEILSNDQMHQLMEGHQYGKNDLDTTGIISSIVRDGTRTYKVSSTDPEVSKLSRVKYQNELRRSIAGFMDELVLEDE